MAKRQKSSPGPRQRGSRYIQSEENQTMECRIAYLRPGQIRARLAECPAVYIPFGPLEWHGPHLPYGMDPLNAEAVALRACAKSGGVVWGTQFWGTERERRPEQLRSLGFKPNEYVVGMDFPNHSLKSMYCPEEVFAIIVREILRETVTLGAKLAVLVNGHGAENHIAVFKRLETEFNASGPLKVYFRLAAPKDALKTGSGEHAAAMETSILMHLHAPSVDLKTLPPHPEPLHYRDYGIVDGPGFDGSGGPEHALTPPADPRTKANPEWGREIVETSASELAEEVREKVKGA